MWIFNSLDKIFPIKKIVHSSYSAPPLVCLRTAAKVVKGRSGKEGRQGDLNNLGWSSFCQQINSQSWLEGSTSLSQRKVLLLKKASALTGLPDRTGLPADGSTQWSFSRKSDGPMAKMGNEAGCVTQWYDMVQSDEFSPMRPSSAIAIISNSPT